MDGSIRNAEPPPDARPGIAQRDQGQLLAIERAAAYRGFSAQLPDIDRVCAALRRSARRGPAGRATIATLEALLQLMPRRRWSEQPILRVTNQHLAARLGYSIRQVQRHLATLHQHGIVAIDWGKANSRLRFDVHARKDGEDGQAGIDLRPAIAYAHEQHALDHAVQVAQLAFHEAHKATLDTIWQAKLALLRQRRSAQLPDQEQQIDRLRADVRSLGRRAYAARAMVVEIQACACTLGAIRQQAAELHASVIHKDGEESEDRSDITSPPGDDQPSQMTESNKVESVVPTNQADGRTGATGREGKAGEPGIDAAIFRQWLAAQAGTPLPSSADVLELELHARQVARRIGIARRVVNEAIERHGPMPAIGAILHVQALPPSARVRSRGALLASLLRRPPGALTAERLTCREAPPEALSESEAAAIARRCAPSHQPYWVCARWHATRRRRQEPIHDPRRCLEAFARTIERTQGRDDG